MADDNDSTKNKSKFWLGQSGPQSRSMDGDAAMPVEPLVMRNPHNGAVVAYYDRQSGTWVQAPHQPTPEEEFMSRGGSEATMHRAQAAGGYRPVIDARSRGGVNDPLAAADRDASDIRSNWRDSSGKSWGPDPGFGNVGGSGSALWGQMTDHFNQRNAQRSAEMLQKRQQVIDRLNPGQPVDNPSKTVSAIPAPPPALGSPSPGFSFGASGAPAALPAPAEQFNPD